MFPPTFARRRDPRHCSQPRLRKKRNHVLQRAPVGTEVALVGVERSRDALVEHRGDASAWLAVCVGAASTWLSFGLLGLSATPALRAFGLTLLFGIGLVWLISPLFRPPPHAPAAD